MLTLKLSDELINKIFSYLSHPCADIIKEYYNKAKSCDRDICNYRNSLLRENIIITHWNYGNYRFNLNLCKKCYKEHVLQYIKIKRKISTFNILRKEYEIKKWLYNNYLLSNEIFNIFEEDIDIFENIFYNI
jgi:hypothetical protein